MFEDHIRPLRGSAHGMCNELHIPGKVALDRLSVGLQEKGQTSFVPVIRSEGKEHHIKNLSLFKVLLCQLTERKAGTPAIVTHRCGVPNPALQASRSCQLQR